MKRKVKMGSMPVQFNEGTYQDITICVTEECNLRCSYCYMYHKNSFKVMNMETAKKAVDFILSLPVKYDACVWNFIGGEPTLEMELVDRITDYIAIRMFELNHPWHYKHAFMISTNGLLYDSDVVQRYFMKHGENAHFAITIDGNKIKHDMHRKRVDGTGSYDKVLNNVKLFMSQHRGDFSTKVTFASADLPLLKDSIVDLWENGISYVAANVVFEDVWKEGDDSIFEEQLKKLADYVIKNSLWDDYSVRFFDPSVGHAVSKLQKQRAYCGTGKMIAVSTDGKLYPCIRFLDFCMDNSNGGYCVGDVENGYCQEKLKPFLVLSTEKSNTDECNDCPVASGCATCVGNNYDYSGGITISKRTTFNCKMHRAQVSANKYFWREYSKKTGRPSRYEINKLEYLKKYGWNVDGQRFIYVLCSDFAVPFCNYNSVGDMVMTFSQICEAATFADENNLIPIYVSNTPEKLPDFIQNTVHVVMYPAKCMYQKSFPLEYCIPVFEDGIVGIDEQTTADACVINLKDSRISELNNFVQRLSTQFRAITINKIGYEKWGVDEVNMYLSELRKVLQHCNKNGVTLNIGKLDEAHNCRAGTYSFSLAPNGKIYACPGFYYTKGKPLGSIKEGVALIEKHKVNCATFCSQCTVFHCNRCPHQSLIQTGDIAVPPNVLCELAQEENKIIEEVMGVLL